MRKRRLMRQLAGRFGAAADEDYFTEDIMGIRAYYEYRRARDMDAFYVDDTTWRDLSMPDVFKRVNAAQTTSGEQVLYSQLRTPAMDEAVFARRQSLLTWVEAHAPARLRVQMLLARMGKRRAININETFTPARHSPLLLFVTLFLVVWAIAAIPLMILLPALRAPLLLVYFINPIYHSLMIRRLEDDLATVNYAVSMVATCRRIARLGEDMPPCLPDSFFAALRRAASIGRFSQVSFAFTSDLIAMVNLIFLTDLAAYERLKSKLSKYRDEIFILHENIGLIDASIAVASFRKSVPVHCDPAVDFADGAAPHLAMEGLVHPLLGGAIPNNADIRAPLLVTGSNASGKSTFLKAVVLNALLAQSICTATAETYAAGAFAIYTSMAIADSVLDGDSYFIAEIKSVKRIVDAAARGERVLCVIDEVLRGTNTVERIAASSELLAQLAAGGVLCLAATHDGELCALLPGYRQVHFEETVREDGVFFDYQLKEGPATGRNAIRLLGVLGFPPALVERASRKAEGYLQSGVWEAG